MFGPDDFEMQIQEEIPGVRTEPSIPPAQDEQYGDFIVKYGQNIWRDYENRPDSEFLPVNEMFGILYVPLNEIGPLEINSYSYASFPKCYTFMDVDALNASGIIGLHNHPYLKLQGEGTAVAVIDSGIDYRNPVFRSGDVSRIAYIWDQTIPGNEDDGQRIREQIRRESNEFNCDSDKPYYVELSVGYHVVRCGSELVISDVLKDADKALYEEKKKRRKSVKKHFEQKK